MKHVSQIYSHLNYEFYKRLCNLERTKIDIDLYISVNRAHMKLTVRNLQTGDFGNYRCISKNSLGETEGSIRLYGKRKTFITF